MPKIEVMKSIIIDVPIENVYPCVADLKRFTYWSPWLILEPETKVTVSDDHQSYGWEGQRIGSGRMIVTSFEKNSSVDYDLFFLKPWKSEAKVRFELKSLESGTEVKWLMHSSLPWFMFWMKSMMVGFIGMDFQRGLLLLKDYAEDGHVHSKLEFSGADTYEGCTYVGLSNSCWIDDIGTVMKDDFEKLQAYFQDKGSIVAGLPICIYHKWNIAKGEAGFTVAIPVTSVPEELPAYMITGSIPSTKVYKLTHIGPYYHLGTPWSAMANLQRSKVFNANKKIHPFERYLNMPGQVPEDELITEVLFAVK